MEQKKQRMQELVQLLNQAGKAYYQDAKEIMSNHEYEGCTMSYLYWSRS